MKPRPKLMVIAGEISGDMHAGRLVQAVRRRCPDLDCFGIGGDALRDAGMEVLVDAQEMAVMGLTEVLKRFPFFYRVFHQMLEVAEERQPDAILLVDYPGFNLRFAARAHNLGLKVLYYICPQVWAWNRGRIPKMAKNVDRLIAIFPFEQAVFARTPLAVDFVGHPLVDEAQKAWQEPPVELPWQGTPRVALLPGSREHEIKRILPVMAAAATLIEQQHPGAGFLIAAPSPPVADIVEQQLQALPSVPRRCAVVTGRTRQVLRQAAAGLVASGTATLEAALMHCPMVVAYKVAGLTYLLGRLLVHVDHIGMVNIVAGRRICPEFLQRQATPAALAAAIEPLLSDTPARARMVQELQQVAGAIGPAGAEERAAEIVLEELNDPGVNR